MPSIDTLLTFALVSFLLSITPGPSVLYIMARSISQGPRAGFAAAGGMAIGAFIYLVATVLGIAAIFQYYPQAFTAVKLFGAAYLLYLGYQYLSADKFDPAQKQTITTLSKGKILRQSVVVELTNPKTALFFLAFLPQFVEFELGSIATQLIVLGTCYTFVTLCCDCGVALISGKLGRWLSKHPKAIYWQDRLAGSVLVGLGILIGYEVFSNL